MKNYNSFFIIRLIPFVLLYIFINAPTLLFAQNKPLKIIAFGNSTTAERANIDQVYTQRLGNALLPYGIIAEVMNEGVPGSHTGSITDNDRHKKEHGRDRFERNVLNLRPDLVIICFGLNDSWVDSDNPKGKSRISLTDYKKNITYFVLSLSKENIKVILMTPNAIGANFEEWRYKRVSKYAQAVRKIAKKENTSLVDVWEMFTQYELKLGNNRDDLMLDGMHPNDLGHEMITDILLKEIVKIYTE